MRLFLFVLTFLSLISITPLMAQFNHQIPPEPPSILNDQKTQPEPSPAPIDETEQPLPKALDVPNNVKDVQKVQPPHTYKNEALPPPVINESDPLDFEDILSASEDVMIPDISKRGQPFSLEDAIFFTLENQIILKLSQLNIDVQKGALRSAAAPFDYYLQGSGNYIDEHNISHTDENGNETLAFFNATKATRIGTSFAFTAQVDKVDNPLSNPETINSGSLSFTVQQPLLQGFLNGVNWMQEKAAQYELYATYFDDFAAISQSILNTTTNYWAAVGNQEILVEQEKSLVRIVNLTREIEELVANNQVAPLDILQPQQQEIDQELNILSAEQTLYSSIQQLKLSMGDLDVDDLQDIPFDLTTDFNIKPLNLTHFQKQFGEYLRHAMIYRFSIQASTLRQIESAYLLKGAANARLPTLNVTGQVTTLSTQIGEKGKPILAPLEMEHPQTNWNIGINLAFPLYNDGATGVWEQRKAQYTQTLLNTQLLQEQTIVSLRNALANQLFIIQGIKEADEIIRISRLLYDNGILQFKVGILSLFDLLSFESRLTSSIITRIGLWTQYMQNIAQLRFLTSTTFEQGSDNNCIEIEDMTTFPEFEIHQTNKKPSAREKYMQNRIRPVITPQEKSMVVDPRKSAVVD